MQQAQPQRKLGLKRAAGTRIKATAHVYHLVEPKKVLMDAIGPIPEGTVQLSNMLVAIYQPPKTEKSAGGVFLPGAVQDDDLDEYLWQGKVGLIVAMGPQAYVDDEATKFHGTKNKVGDWVWFKPSDGMACEVNGVFCRVFADGRIIGRLPDPDCIW